MEMSYYNKNAFKKGFPNVLETFYSVDELWAIICDILLPSQGKNPPQKKPKKAVMVEQLIELFVDPATATAFFEAMSPQLYAAIELLVWKGDWHLDELEETLGFEISSKKTTTPRYHYEQEHTEHIRKNTFCWIVFENDGHYQSDIVFVRLPPFVRKMFREHMPKPADYNLVFHKTLPEGTTTYRCDDSIAEDLRGVADYIARGHLQYTKAEVIKKKLYPRPRKANARRRVFPDEKSSAKLPLLRQELLTNIVASCGASLRQTMLEDPPDPEQIIRPLSTELFNHPDWLLEYVLTHLSGNSHGPYNKKATAKLKSIFCELSAEHWTSVSNLKSYVSYRDIDLDPDPFARAFVNIEPITEDYYRTTRIELDSGNCWPLLYTPLLQGTALSAGRSGMGRKLPTTPRRTTPLYNVNQKFSSPPTTGFSPSGSRRSEPMPSAKPMKWNLKRPNTNVPKSSSIQNASPPPAATLIPSPNSPCSTTWKKSPRAATASPAKASCAVAPPPATFKNAHNNLNSTSPKNRHHYGTAFSKKTAQTATALRAQNTYKVLRTC